MKRLILLTALMAVFLSAPPNSAQENQPDDLEKQVSTLYQEWINSPDPANWFTKNEARLSPELAKKAEEIAADFVHDHEFEAANHLFRFAGITRLHLGDRAGALEEFINSMQMRLLIAETFEQFQTLTQDASAVSSKAESIRRYDLQFEAAVVAANSTYVGSQTRKGRDEEEPIADTLKDCVAALKTIQYADRFYFERFVSLLADVIKSATSVPFVATENAQSDVNELLKQIAKGAEQSIPSDFKYTEPKLGSPESTIETAAKLAGISYRFGSASSARARLTIAAQRAREAGDTDTWLRMVSFRYSSEREAGVPAALLEKLRDDAWDSAQQLRVEYRSRAGRIWVAYRTDLFYADMLSDQLQVGAAQPAKTFAAAEILKARTLLDAIHSKSRSGVPANGEQLQSDVLGFNAPRTGKDDLRLGEMRLVSQLSPFNLGEDETQKRLKALAELEKSYKAANLGFTDSAPIAQLRDIQAALQPHEGIIEYIMPFERLGPADALWILFISKKEFHAVRAPLDLLIDQGSGFVGRISADGEAPIDSGPFDDLVVGARAAVRESDEKKAKAYLHNLYVLLIDPLSRDGVRLEDYERIAIVPHGMLHYVPFPALLDANGHFLISKTALTIVPSASIWLALLERRGPAKQFVGMGNPALEKGAAELPYSGQEMEAIAKEMASAAPKVLEGPDATKGHLAREAPAANILHLATHGLFPDDNAMDNHAVILSADNGDDGTLTAARIRQMDLHATRLAVLSVCNGGLYRIGPADSPFGLIPAFIEAGSQNVMGTLWPLDDRFGRDFMVEYYSHLLQDGPAKAYQKTAMRFIGDDEYIRNWAGFVLVGPGRPFGAAQN